MNDYIFVKVEGKNINKFLLKCITNKIFINEIKYNSYRSIIIKTNKSNYVKIRKIKGIYNIKIVDYQGKTKNKLLLKKYRILIISFFVGIIILILLSNIIFEVDVISNNYELNDLIIKDLSNYGIEKYKFRKSFDEIENKKKKIINKYKNKIEWIEIKRIGIKYKVNFVERKIEDKNTDKNYYSIVSKRSGVVKKIITEKGNALVSGGTYVNKGDVLISSDIMSNEEIKGKVSAKGKVYAETWYKVNVSYPLYYEEIKYTNKRKRIPYIKIGNKYIELFKYKDFDRRIIANYKEKITGFEIGIEELREKHIIKRKYSGNDALKMAIRESEIKIQDKLDDDEYIIYKKTLNFYNKGSKIIVDIFFSVCEEIGEKRVIEMGEANDSKNTGERIQ